MIIVAIVVALLAALLIADRAALIYAENQVARRIRDWGFSAKPHVSIAGIPLLDPAGGTAPDQGRDQRGRPELGPIEVRRLDLTLYQIQVSPRYRAGTAAQLGGTALVGFAGLAGVVGLPGPGRSLAQRLVADGELGAGCAGQAGCPGAGVFARAWPQDRQG